VAQGVAWEELKKGIVQVHSDLGYGSGIVIVATPAVVRVLTCNHLIKGATRTSVTFYSDRGRPFEAQPLPAVVDQLDLAVLEVALTAAKLPPRDIPSYGVREKESLRQGERIWIMDSAWNIAPTTIAGLNDESDSDRLIYPRVVTARGFSGAPVLDDEGQLIALHTAGEFSGRYGKAIKIRSAIESLNLIGYSTPNCGPTSTLDGDWMLISYGPLGTPSGGMTLTIAGKSVDLTIPNNDGLIDFHVKGEMKFDGRQLQIKMTSFINPVTQQPFDSGSDPVSAAMFMDTMNSYMKLSFTRQPDGSFTGSTFTGERWRMVRQRGR
jgi:hypothetical protein